MAYDAEKDEYTCAQGQKLREVTVKKQKSETGYIRETSVYECADCKDCPVKETCIRQKKTDKTPLEDRVKRLYVSKYFIQQREAMEKKISTDEGILLRVNRSIQAEGVFAAIKEDLNFRRFLTRGNANVTVEWYLVSMAYYFSHTHTAPPGCGSEADVSDASPRLKICLLAVKMFILQRESIVCALVDRQNKQI